MLVTKLYLSSTWNVSSQLSIYVLDISLFLERWGITYRSE